LKGFRLDWNCKLRSVTLYSLPVPFRPGLSLRFHKLLYIWLMLFSPFGTFADRAIYFACVNFFFSTWAKLCQDLLDQFSRTVHQMKGICMNFLDPDLFFDPFRDVAMSTNFGQKKFTKWTLFNTLLFHNRFAYRSSDLQVLKGTIFATFCAISVKTSPLTPEIMQGVSVPAKNDM